MRYWDAVLKPYVRLYRGAVGFDILMDNARPRRANLVDHFIERADIRQKDWPARSSIPELYTTCLRRSGTEQWATRNPYREPSRA